MIGEATKCIPREIRENYPGYPWAEMASMRDKLIHAYFGINRAIIWRTIQDDIPPLRFAVQSLHDDLISEETRDASPFSPRDP